MRRKIDLAKLGQKKVTNQIAETNDQKDLKQDTCNLMKNAFQVELDKVEQKDRVTKIIYDIYLKEV